MKICRHIEKLKEFHSEYQYTYNLYSIIINLCCWLYHISIHLSLLSTNQYILFFDAF